jgi:hypothetical protein
MRRSIRRLVAIVTCAPTPLVMTLCAATVMSSATSLARSREPERVVFVLQEETPAAGVLRTFDRMEAQLGELELDISAVYLPREASLQRQAERAAKVASVERAKAVFWFEQSSGGEVRVYALHALSGRVFARDVSLRGDTTAQREELSIVLRAAIQALLDGSLELGKPLLVVPPETVPQSTEKRERAPAIRAPVSNAPKAALVAERLEAWRFAVALGYIGSSIAEDFDWQSGVVVDLVFRVPHTFRASLGTGYAMPTTIRGAGADALVSRVPIEARLGVERAFGPGTLTLEAGPLLDVWQRRTTVRSEALVPTAPRTTLRWGSVLGLRVEAPVLSAVSCFLSLEAQWLPSEHALSVRSSQGEQQEQTRNLRPQIGTGVIFELGSEEKNRGQAE